MNGKKRPRLSRMWQLYLALLASVLVFACCIPMLAMYLMGVDPKEYALFLPVSAGSVLVSNLLIFVLIRRRVRAMLNAIVDRTAHFVDLPDEIRNAKPSMEVDMMESLYCRMLNELHEAGKGRLRGEREGMLATIASLIAALESRDKYTQNHSARVAALSGKIAREMGLPRKQIDDLRLAAILHDVGKIGIRDAVLLKTGPLTREEYAIIMAHPRIAGEILRPIKGLGHVIDLIVHHHERPDGRGYPDNLAGDDVQIGAYIIAAADTYDAMTIDRPYRAALPPDKVVSELIVARSTQLHADCVDALTRVMLRDNRLGLAVALTGSAWAKAEREAAMALGHVFDDEPRTSGPAVGIEDIAHLAEEVRRTTPVELDAEDKPTRKGVTS